MFTSLFLTVLNRDASSAGSRPAEIIASLNIRQGDVIADIGSGGGYFTLAFARESGKTGHVYAVDVKPKYLEFIRSKAARERLVNISYILGVGEELNLPGSGLDLVFARNVFHHLPSPAYYFGKMKKYLKPGARIAIIEHIKKGFGFVALFGHHTSPETIVRDMDKAGYSRFESFDFLPHQTFTLFTSK